MTVTPTAIRTESINKTLFATFSHELSPDTQRLSTVRSVGSGLTATSPFERMQPFCDGSSSMGCKQMDAPRDHGMYCLERLTPGQFWRRPLTSCLHEAE